MPSRHNSIRGYALSILDQVFYGYYRTGRVYDRIAQTPWKLLAFGEGVSTGKSDGHGFPRRHPEAIRHDVQIMRATMLPPIKTLKLTANIPRRSIESQKLECMDLVTKYATNDKGVLSERILKSF